MQFMLLIKTEYQDGVSLRLDKQQKLSQAKATAIWPAGSFWEIASIKQKNTLKHEICI